MKNKKAINLQLLQEYQERERNKNRLNILKVIKLRRSLMGDGLTYSQINRYLEEMLGEKIPKNTNISRIKKTRDEGYIKSFEDGFKLTEKGEKEIMDNLISP